MSVGIALATVGAGATGVGDDATDAAAERAGRRRHDGPRRDRRSRRPRRPSPPPAGTRGGAADGSVAKPRSETWSPRRIATMTALAVIALAAAGYAYGKLRSAPPRHPDLAPRPPDLDGADHLEPTS